MHTTKYNLVFTYYAAKKTFRFIFGSIFGLKSQGRKGLRACTIKRLHYQHFHRSAPMWSFVFPRCSPKGQFLQKRTRERAHAACTTANYQLTFLFFCPNSTQYSYQYCMGPSTVTRCISAISLTGSTLNCLPQFQCRKTERVKVAQQLP